MSRCTRFSSYYIKIEKFLVQGFCSSQGLDTSILVARLDPWFGRMKQQKYAPRDSRIFYE